MYVMKVIWLLLAACPCMSRDRTDTSRQNIPEEVLEEILSDVGNREMLLSRPKSTKQMAIVRSLLQGEITDDESFESSHCRHRNREMLLSRPKSTMQMAIVRSLLRGEAVDDDSFESSRDRRRNLPRTSKRTQNMNRKECCPSVSEKIAPLGGISRRGKLLQLFRDEDTVQRFYQSRCSSGVANRPCQYIDREYTSKCVQLYTYMYAIVKYHNVSEPYRLDYIRVKSGCSCQILT